MDPFPSVSSVSSVSSTSSTAPVLEVTRLNAGLVTQLLVPPEQTDHSAEVRELAKNKIWSSIPPESYEPNGKINFLHINKDGVCVITVFKPNTKPRRIYAKIKPEEVAAVLERLQWMKKWDIVEETGWDNMNGVGDVDGNTYRAHRAKILWENGFEFHWMVSHKNVGNQVLVEDELLIARDRKIEIEEDGTEDPVD